MKMNSSDSKPLVTISTYEERQQENQRPLNDLLHTKSNNEESSVIRNNTNLIEHRSHCTYHRSSGNDDYGIASQTPPKTPSPDYDFTPTATLEKPLKYSNMTPKGTIARRSATEYAKANGDMAELESIKSFKLQNPGQQIPQPPPMYFSPLNSGPPTMKKTKKSVAVTIGEYGGKNSRKEPSKLDFITKGIDQSGNNCRNNNNNNNITHMLRNELEATLSRSNLRREFEKRTSFMNGLKTKDKDNTIVAELNQGRLSNSGDVEKLTAMLEKKVSCNESSKILSNNNNDSSQNFIAKNSSPSHGGHNRVTINIADGFKSSNKRDSIPPSPVIGILKNDSVRSSMSCDKSISFG